MPDVNPAKTDFVCLTDEILVYRDGEELWRGRAITREEDFYKTGTLTCEGVLAYLYDTYYPPFEFSGSPTDFLSAVLDNHNAQVEERKRIYLGNVTVEDNNDYIARSSIEYNRTLTVLTDKLINDSLGGYFRVRIKDGVKYLDYLASYDTTATQPVAFGENLLDLAQNVEYSDLATVILPLGAKLEDSDGNQTDEYLTIADVNGGSIYYADEAAVAEYGWIVVCNIWDDVTEASNLLTKAKNYLAQVTSAVSSFEVNAVDLAIISSDYAPINLGDMVLIQSEPHGVNQYVELTSLTIDLLDPSNDTLTFGADTATLTDSQRSSSRSVQAALESLSVRYTNLVATVITTDYLTANYITANDIAAKYVTTDTLTANYITATDISAKYVTTDTLKASYLTATDIAAKYVATEYLTANYITATDIAAKYVTTDTLTANYITASDIEAKYAAIDLANVSVESVGTLFADVGLLTSMTVVDGYITGALNGVTISANQLTAGTIDAGTIDVVNLNCANLTVGTINGSQIASGTITAENLSEDITSAITTAQQTADGKNAVYYANTAPSGGTYSVNDIWYDTANGYAMYYWSGSEWVKAVYGASALSDEVTADIAEALEKAGLASEAVEELSTNAVTGTTTYYAVSDSRETAPTEDWSTIPPDVGEGEYLWQKTRTTYANGGTVDSTPVCISGRDGSDGVDGEDAVLLRIDSSRGTVFKNASISTVLSVTIYYGSLIITDASTLASAFGAGAYLEWSWQKMDENTFGTILSTDSRLSNSGFSLTLTPDDIDTKAVFQCTLNV